MRYLILALCCLSAYGQEATSIPEQIAHIDSRLEIIRPRLEILRDSVSVLESRKRILLGELAAAEMERVDGALVRTKQYTLLYDTAVEAQTQFSAKDQEGIITKHDNGRFYFEGINGMKGWIGRDQFVFTLDASEYVEAILESGDLQQGTRGWLINAQSPYKQKIRIIIADEEKRLEEERQADYLQNMYRAGIPLMLAAITFKVNSAGGVEPKIVFLNISNKTFKYVTVTLQAFNAVADPVLGRFKGVSNFSLRLVGPIVPTENATYNFDSDPPFYNKVTSCLAVKSIVIEYVEGGKYTMVADLATSRYSKDNYNIAGECG